MVNKTVASRKNSQNKACTNLTLRDKICKWGPLLRKLFNFMADKPPAPTPPSPFPKISDKLDACCGTSTKLLLQGKPLFANLSHSNLQEHSQHFDVWCRFLFQSLRLTTQSLTSRTFFQKKKESPYPAHGNKLAFFWLHEYRNLLGDNIYTRRSSNALHIDF